MVRITPRRLTKRELARRSAIIHELARLSRNGWRNASPSDYLPLEDELKVLNRKVR